jgi:hypothetical protein
MDIPRLTVMVCPQDRRLWRVQECVGRCTVAGLGEIQIKAQSRLDGDLEEGTLFDFVFKPVYQSMSKSQGSRSNSCVRVNLAPVDMEIA